MNKRKVFAKIKLNEISVVDKPAQIGAQVILIKRAGGQHDDEYKVLKGIFDDALMEQKSMNDYPSVGRKKITSIAKITRDISNNHYALQSAIKATQTFDAFGDKSTAVKQIAADYFTKVYALLDNLSKVISNSRVKKMNKADLNKTIAKAVTDALADGKSENDDETVAIAKSIVSALTPVLNGTDSTANALSIAQLPSEQREYLADIAKAIDITDADKEKLVDEFLSTDNEASKTAVVKAWNASTDTYKTGDGRILKRSDLGAAYDVLVDEIKKNEGRSKELELLKQESANAVLIAKSRKELPNLVGDDKTRLALEKVLCDLPDTEQVNLRKSLTASSVALSSSFRQLGVEGEQGSTNAEQLDSLAHKVVEKSDGSVTFSKAFQQVLETPEGEELYNAYVDESRMQ